MTLPSTSVPDVPTREERVEAIAANLAYWWRMSFSDDYSEPQCGADWWMGAAKFAATAYERGK